MDINPYESPGAADPPTATPHKPPQIWLEMLRSAIVICLLIPATTYLLFVIVKYFLVRSFF